MWCVFFFFFKQNTAYDMRISDWSSDVCSSDLRRFRNGAYSSQRARFDSLAHDGQSHKVMVIDCSDSRVDPSMIFDSGPGEMFVVRNVATLVPPFAPDRGRHGVSDALEFALNQLEVPEFVVIGQ